MLVFAVRRWVGRRFIPIEHDRDDHVSLPGMPEHTLELLPVGDIEAGVVEAGIREVVRAHGDPGVGVRTELLVRDNRLAPKTGRPAAAQKDMGASPSWRNLPWTSTSVNGFWTIAGLTWSVTSTKS